MPSLLDTINPSNPPEAKGARLVRPMGRSLDDEIEDTTAKTAAPATTAAPHHAFKVAREAPKMNSKAASLRALLHDHPDGMDYDQMCKATGIARDKIGMHVSGLMSVGDVKKFLRGDGTPYFKFAGDLSKVSDRKADQQPSAKPTAPTESKTATPPPGQRASAPHGSGAASAAVTKSATPPAALAAAPSKEGAEPARAAAPVQQTAGVDVPAIAVSAHTERRPTSAVPAEPKRREQLDLMTELTIVAAANLAAEVRALDFTNGPALARALRNFDRADKLREEIKAEARG